MTTRAASVGRALRLAMSIGDTPANLAQMMVAAALVFNGAITPHAADFGLGTVELGAVAQIAAGLGRTMSPVAGAAIICAGLAGINPMEIVKRNALPTVVAVVVVTVAMFI